MILVLRIDYRIKFHIAKAKALFIQADSINTGHQPGVSDKAIT